MEKISEFHGRFDESLDTLRQHQENELTGINERIKIISDNFDTKLEKITDLLLKIPGVQVDEANSSEGEGAGESQPMSSSLAELEDIM